MTFNEGDQPNTTKIYYEANLHFKGFLKLLTPFLYGVLKGIEKDAQIGM